MNHAGGQHEYACIAGGENHDGCDERGNAVNPIVDEADNYGWMDYRSISGWKFPAWPLLQPSTRAKMTIGTLHAKVVEARGLISRDFAGRSDPFAELELTGRYLSHGQEWSEPLRVREKTRVIKFSLNPVWNEEFSLPVRRAGAVLRIRLWDWNASIPDDPLGHIEVKMGGDLLAQKDGVPLHEPSIEERRESYGEVRLQLRFEFNELAETCSYIWPEEPPKRPLKEFSPNRIYYNVLLLQQLLLPYLEFLDGVGRVVGWVHPWTSLFCLISLALLVLYPGMLIVSFNAVPLWIVTTRYLSHVIAQRRAESSGRGPGSVDDIETGTKTSKKLKKRIRQLQETFLPPMEETTDREMDAILASVSKTKKLPSAVEQIGKKALAKDGRRLQNDLEFWGVILMLVRRLFHPLEVKVLLGTIGIIVAHTLLQLGLYFASWIRLYFLLVLVGLFASNFYAWRGRAFFLAVQAARQSRRTRWSITHPTPQTGQGGGTEDRNAGGASGYPFFYGPASSTAPGPRSSPRSAGGLLAAAALAPSPALARLASSRAKVDETSNLLGPTHRAGEIQHSRTIGAGGGTDAVDGEEDGVGKKWSPAAVAAGGAVAFAVAPGAVALAGVVAAARAAARAAKSKSAPASSSASCMMLPALFADDSSTEGAPDGLSEAASVNVGREDSPRALLALPSERTASVDRAGGSVGRIAPGSSAAAAPISSASPAAAAAAAPATPRSSSLSRSPSRQASVMASTKGPSGVVAASTAGEAMAMDANRAEAFSRAAGSFNASRNDPNRGSPAHVGGAGGERRSGSDSGSGRGSDPAAKPAAPSHDGMLGNPGKGPEENEGSKDDEPERDERTGGRAKRFLHGSSRLMHGVFGKHHHRDRSHSHVHDDDDHGDMSGPDSTRSGISHSGKWHRPHWGRSSKKSRGDAGLDTSRGSSRNDAEDIPEADGGWA